MACIQYLSDWGSEYPFSKICNTRWLCNARAMIVLQSRNHWMKYSPSNSSEGLGVITVGVKGEFLSQVTFTHLHAPRLFSFMYFASLCLTRITCQPHGWKQEEPNARADCTNIIRPGGAEETGIPVMSGRNHRNRSWALEVCQTSVKNRLARSVDIRIVNTYPLRL